MVNKADCLETVMALARMPTVSLDVRRAVILDERTQWANSHYRLQVRLSVIEGINPQDARADGYRAEIETCVAVVDIYDEVLDYLGAIFDPDGQLTGWAAPDEPDEVDEDEIIGEEEPA